MTLAETFFHIPVATVVRQPEEVAAVVLDKVAQLPVSVKTMLSSPKTGAYLRGVGRQYKLSMQSIPNLSFIVLRVYIGQLTRASLSSALSAELQLPTSTAEAISRDIEHDLLAPLALDLNNFLQQQDAASSLRKTESMKQAGARNTINLTSIKRPQPPRLPSE